MSWASDRIHQEIEQTTRRLELEKRRLQRLEKELSLSRKTVSVKMGMLNPPSSTPKNGSSTRSSVLPGEKDIYGGASETQRRVRPQSLSRFDAELKKLNEVKHSNKMMRVQIDGVRKERLHLNRVFEKLKTEIKQRAEQLLEFVEETQSSQRVYDEADQRMTAMRRQREADRTKFKEKVLKIRSALRDNEFERQELEVELKRADAGVQRKKVLITSEEEKEFSENAMIRRIMKTAFLNCIQRRHIKQHQKSIMVFEQAFATIKQTTCISNIEEIVRIFVQLESRNYSLLTYVNHMNREMDHLTGLQRERKELEADANEGDYQQKLQALADTKRAVSVATAALKTAQETHAKQTKITNDIKPLLAEIVGRLQDEVRTLREAGSTCFGDELRKLPNEMRDESLPTFLEWVEVVMSRFRDLIPTLPEKEPPFPPTVAGTVKKLQAKRFGVTPTLVKAQDLPSASLQGDEAGGPTKRLGGTAAPKTVEDDEEDEDKDFNEKPLSLKDIRERAEKALRRRKRAAPRSSLVNIFDMGSLGVTGPGSPLSAVQAHQRQKADSAEAEDEDSGSGSISDSGSIADSGQDAEALENGEAEEGEDAS